MTLEVDEAEQHHRAMGHSHGAQQRHDPVLPVADQSPHEQRRPCHRAK